MLVALSAVALCVRAATVEAPETSFRRSSRQPLPPSPPLRHKTEP